MLCVCLQLVDGRRLDDAFVADLLCPRLHGGTAPIVAYVSAPLVRVRVSECAFVRVCVCGCVCVCVCACLLVRVGVCVCVSRYRTIDIFQGIDFVLMEKSLVSFKVMYTIDLPLRCAPAHDTPPFRNKRGGPASTSHHAALNGSTIFPCPRGLMHAPQCPLSSDVLMVHAQVDHIMDQLAPSIMICTVAGLILLGHVLLVSVSWFAP